MNNLETLPACKLLKKHLQGSVNAPNLVHLRLLNTSLSMKCEYHPLCDYLLSAWCYITSLYVTKSPTPSQSVHAYR